MCKFVGEVSAGCMGKEGDFAAIQFANEGDGMDIDLENMDEDDFVK